MDSDHGSSFPEESTDDFVRRKVRLERDFTEEALARKELAERLVKQRSKPKLPEFRPGSVIQLRKKDAPVYKPEPEKKSRPENKAKPVAERVVEVAVPSDSRPFEGNELPKTLNVVEPQTVSEEKVPDPRNAPRTTADQKLRAMAEIAVSFGDPRNLTATALINCAAIKMETGRHAVRTFWNRTLTAEQKKFLLYGERGKKITRGEKKFLILLEVREGLRRKGGPAPRKKELIKAAIQSLGMTPFSVATYVYERLTDEQVRQLDLRVDEPAPLEKQLEIFRRLRAEMAQKKLPPPRQLDLAEAAAPELKMTIGSVRALISALPQKYKDELDLLQSRSGRLKGLEPEVVRAGFMGALAVLKIRRQLPTMRNLRLVLQLKEAVLRSYLKEHPDIVDVIARELKA